MANSSRSYPEEFKRDIVALARKGETSKKQITADVGIPETTLYRWIKRFDVDEGRRPGATSDGVWGGRWTVREDRCLLDGGRPHARRRREAAEPRAAGCQEVGTCPTRRAVGTRRPLAVAALAATAASSVDARDQRGPVRAELVEMRDCGLLHLQSAGTEHGGHDHPPCRTADVQRRPRLAPTGPRRARNGSCLRPARLRVEYTGGPFRRPWVDQNGDIRSRSLKGPTCSSATARAPSTRAASPPGAQRTAWPRPARPRP